MRSMGTDAGTTQTKAALVDESSGKAVPVSNSRGEPTTPSVIYLQDDGAYLIGRDAVEQAPLMPQRAVFYPKLHLGSTDSLIKDAVVTPTDAVAVLIGQAKEDAERQIGAVITHVVLTCPANFRDDQKAALREAAERCGLEVLRIIPEPSAAALAYVVLNQPMDGKYLAFDLGGGTFDATVVQVKGQNLTVLGTQGVAKLGGNDFTNCLLQHVLAEIEKVVGRRPTPESDPLLFVDLNQRLEDAKRSLGKRSEVHVVASVDGQQVICNIKQDDFHRDVRPLVDQALNTVDQVLAAQKMSFSDLTRIIMVGGASRMPFVQERLAEHSGMRPCLDVNPELAISAGAAIAAELKLAELTPGGTAVSKLLPNAGLREVTAHAIGCTVVDKSASQKRYVQSVMIEKNTPVPHTYTDRFYLEDDRQTDVRVEILQGEPGAERARCLVIGEMKIDNLPHESVRSERIEVTYHIDENGMVRATAKDRVSGQSASTQVDYKRGVKTEGQDA